MAIKVKETYGCDVAAVLPYCPEMLTLASGGIFSHHYPDHHLTAQFRQIAEKIER